MSSANNHKARSHRGHLKNKGFLAPKHSPLIRAYRKEHNRLFRKFFKGVI